MSSLKIDYRPELYNPPRSCPLKIGTVALLPGMENEVDATVWENIKNNPKFLVSSLMEIGIIREILPPKAKEAKTPKLAPLKVEETKEEEIVNGVPGSNAKALELIVSTSDISTLETWLQTETRTRIKTAIEKRIETLKTPQTIEV